MIIYMSKNLVIVESPAKAHTIEKYLGSDYKVLASVGHIRKDTKVDKSTFDVTTKLTPTTKISSLNLKKKSKKLIKSGSQLMKTARESRYLGIYWRFWIYLKTPPESLFTRLRNRP